MTKRKAPVSLAPVGKTALKVVMATNFACWLELQRAPERYDAEKQCIAEAVIGLLEKRFPGLRQQIEVVDVATPMMTLRYTGSGHGYRSPTAAMARALFTGWRLSQILTGLRNFYMVGQWAGIAGVPLVAAMARDVAAAICRTAGRRFTNSFEAGRSTACRCRSSARSTLRSRDQVCVRP